LTACTLRLITVTRNVGVEFMGSTFPGCLRIGLSKCAQTQVIPAANKFWFSSISLWQYLPPLLSIEFRDCVVQAVDHDSSFSDADIGKGVKQPKNIQQPQNHGNDHDAVQD
jgi:hypothetical protein